MVDSSGLNCCLASEYLRRECEGIRQEQSCEFLQLTNFDSTQFFVVMHALIPIKTDKVCPLFQVSGQLAAIGKKVDAFCKGFSGTRGIKLASCNVNRFAKHRGSCIGVSPARVIETLRERSLYCCRYVIGCLESVLLRILSNDCHVAALGNCIEVTSAIARYPTRSIRRMKETKTEDFTASIAGKGSSTFVGAGGNNPDWPHRHPGHCAMRAIPNKSYRHIHSMVALGWALRGES